MNLIDDALVSPNDTLREAMQRINRTGLQTCFVTGADRVVVGVITDGDIRRALLRGDDLNTLVSDAMNTGFKALNKGDDPRPMLSEMVTRGIHVVPILDKIGRAVQLLRTDDQSRPPTNDTLIFLMAGGLGSRLRPLTDKTPKPMLQISSRPILEHIIENFKKQGFWRFAISVNYLREKIESHFADGSDFGVEIQYVREKERTGTAGSLALLKDIPEKPFIVMNGDLLSGLNFNALLEFHKNNQTSATICSRIHEVHVPFGVVETIGPRMVQMVEKPSHKFFVNAGIYVLEPSTLKTLKGEAYLDMPDFLNLISAAGQDVAVFPLNDYWIDIGQPEDLEKARAKFEELAAL